MTSSPKLPEISYLGGNTDKVGSQSQGDLEMGGSLVPSTHKLDDCPTQRQGKGASEFFLPSPPRASQLFSLSMHRDFRLEPGSMVKLD